MGGGIVEGFLERMRVWYKAFKNHKINHRELNMCNIVFFWYDKHWIRYDEHYLHKNVVLVARCNELVVHKRTTTKTFLSKELTSNIHWFGYFCEVFEIIDNIWYCYLSNCFILQCECVFNNDRNLTYSCVYVPSMEGEYKVRAHNSVRTSTKSKLYDTVLKIVSNFVHHRIGLCNEVSI